MRWQPEAGHVPRGFLGARGSLEEVELVLVFAEPGNPQPDEKHSGLESALRGAHFYHRFRRDRFHRNVGYILDLCWPHLCLDEQLSKVWLTESVLCSAPVEGGHVSRAVELACGERYLKHQLDLFPHALIVALGSKAQRRLDALGFTRYLAASAVAPPGCNRSSARPSWERIPVELAKLQGRHVAAVSPAIQEALPSRAPEAGHTGQPLRRPSRKGDDLAGAYQIVDCGRLQATEESDAGKWSIWRHVWACRSFEELAEACPEAAYTRTKRRITWRTEARWALKCGWIRKVEGSCSGN